MKFIITVTLVWLLQEVTMAQNVGIGTNSTSHKLDVAGRVRIR